MIFSNAGYSIDRKSSAIGESVVALAVPSFVTRVVFKPFICILVNKRKINIYEATVSITTITLEQNSLLVDTFSEHTLRDGGWEAGINEPGAHLLHVATLNSF